MSKIQIKNWVILLSCLLLGGLYCALTRQEIWYDFANYHYYNAWALIHGKTFSNIAPAGVHSYFNPLLDCYTYFLVHFFNQSPRVVFFFQGLWLGFLCFLFYQFIMLVFDPKTYLEKFLSLCAFCFSILGYSIIRQAGVLQMKYLLRVFF